MERAWQIWKTIGGVVLLFMALVYLAGSVERHRPLRNGAEFLAAFDHVHARVVHEVRRGLHWLSTEGW